jgi:hypothetical protein
MPTKVFAIDLQMPLGGHEQPNTLTGVLSRAVSVMILQNERQSLKLADATVTAPWTRGIFHDRL